MQHFYTPNLLILIARVLAQVQINACAFIHPTKSLMGLSLMLVVLNLAAAFLHLLDFAGGMNGGKGLILDFVGQANPASLTRILLLDLLLFLIQLTGLCVSYVNHSTNLPKSPSLAYDDLLLPPTEEEIPIPSTTLFDEEEMDLEGGTRQRKARKGKYQAVEGEELWLDDDEGMPSSSGNSIRITEPPLIFSLPLRHIILLILKLPSPIPPPRAFSGGTPIHTPPFTPPIAPLARIPDEDETSDEVRRNGEGEGELGRIPGEYRGQSQGG
nr:hypothetical protein I302_00145 [Kwoniella bestiolae CBS 10118]OCF28656.1 hypothetical protein I302_00145 [Kwoniella bestiolae CBS 10118]